MRRGLWQVVALRPEGLLDRSEVAGPLQAPVAVTVSEHVRDLVDVGNSEAEAMEMDAMAGMLSVLRA